MGKAEPPPADIARSITTIFGTPFMSYDWLDSDDINAELAELILAREAADESGRGIRSNAGGWQSPGNMITWPEECVQLLKERVEEMVLALLGTLIRKDGGKRTFQLMVDSWANVCRNGNYNVVHTHPNAMWSLVYYVQRGEPDESIPYSGMLELIDPRESANYIQVQNTVLDARTFIDAVPGRMVLFPSWVRHMVHPFIGEGVRISIASNVNVMEEDPVMP